MSKKPTDFQDLCNQAWATAEEHGWHESTIGANTLIPEKLLMLHTEISEAVEDFRTRGPEPYYEDDKPCGVMIELADIFIRLADLACIVQRELKGRIGTKITLEEAVREKMQYNQQRAYRHGDKAL